MPAAPKRTYAYDAFCSRTKKEKSNLHSFPKKVETNDKPVVLGFTDEMAKKATIFPDVFVFNLVLVHPPVWATLSRNIGAVLLCYQYGNAPPIIGGQSGM